jgi:hypothetical protein
MCDLISRFGHPPELQVFVITTTTIIIIKEKRESRVYCCCSKCACRSSISPAGFLGEKGVVTVSLSISLLGMRYVPQREREIALHSYRMLMVPHLCFKNIENPKPFFVCLSVTSNRSCSLGCGETRIAPV